jgi:hypothetical protein
MQRTTSSLITSLNAVSTVPIIAFLCCVFLSSGVACKGGQGSGTKAHPPVLKLLAPLGSKRSTLTVERTKGHTGYTRKMAPRTLEATQNDRGVVYRIRERIDAKTWRIAAQLFVDARPDGAWIRSQHGLGGRRVGAKTPRLLFPWPPKPGTPHRVSYAIADGRKATGTVTVLRYGFSRAVAGKTYQPCLEVREVLSFNRGGGIDLRSVYCVGFGRVEIESKHQSPSKGLRTIVDRSTGLK